jgi:hypothetical protein
MSHAAPWVKLPDFQSPISNFQSAILFSFPRLKLTDVGDEILQLLIPGISV